MARELGKKMSLTFWNLQKLALLPDLQSILTICFMRAEINACTFSLMAGVESYTVP